MAYSQASLIKRVRQELNDVPFYDTCTEAMDTTETGLDVAATSEWAVGDVVEFQDDGEQCLVTALASATTLTVRRNHNFSVGATAGTGTNHSINAAIVKTPLFPYANVVTAIEGATQSLWPTVYHVLTDDITPVVGTKYYAATAGAMDIIQATQMTTDSPAIPKFYGTRKGAYPIQLLHNLPTASFTSGSAYYIPHFFNTTNHVFIAVAFRIDDTVGSGNYTYLTDGLVVEAVVYLTAADLVLSTDIARATDQDNNMNDQSVSPGARAQLGSQLRRLGQTKKEQARLDLARRSPRLPVWQGVQ